MRSATLETIAKQHLGFDTLETRNSDSQDFRDLAAWQVKAALEAAFEAGRQAPARGGMTAASAAVIAGISGDEAAILQMAQTRLLVAAANGSIDLTAMARAELASRGLDVTGRWVGFAEAAAALAA